MPSSPPCSPPHPPNYRFILGRDLTALQARLFQVEDENSFLRHELGRLTASLHAEQDKHADLVMQLDRLEAQHADCEACLDDTRMELLETQKQKEILEVQLQTEQHREHEFKEKVLQMENLYQKRATSLLEQQQRMQEKLDRDFDTRLQIKLVEHETQWRLEQRAVEAEYTRSMDSMHQQLTASLTVREMDFEQHRERGQSVVEDRLELLGQMEELRRQVVAHEQEELRLTILKRELEQTFQTKLALQVAIQVGEREKQLEADNAQREVATVAKVKDELLAQQQKNVAKAIAVRESQLEREQTLREEVLQRQHASQIIDLQTSVDQLRSQLLRERTAQQTTAVQTQPQPQTPQRVKCIHTAVQTLHSHHHNVPETRERELGPHQGHHGTPPHQHGTPPSTHHQQYQTSNNSSGPPTSNNSRDRDNYNIKPSAPQHTDTPDSTVYSDATLYSHTSPPPAAHVVPVRIPSTEGITSPFKTQLDSLRQDISVVLQHDASTKSSTSPSTHSPTMHGQSTSAITPSTPPRKFFAGSPPPSHPIPATMNAILASRRGWGPTLPLAGNHQPPMVSPPPHTAPPKHITTQRFVHQHCHLLQPPVGSGVPSPPRQHTNHTPTSPKSPPPLNLGPDDITDIYNTLLSHAERHANQDHQKHRALVKENCNSNLQIIQLQKELEVTTTINRDLYNKLHNENMKLSSELTSKGTQLEAVQRELEHQRHQHQQLILESLKERPPPVSPSSARSTSPPPVTPKRMGSPPPNSSPRSTQSEQQLTQQHQQQLTQQHQQQTSTMLSLWRLSEDELVHRCHLALQQLAEYFNLDKAKTYNIFSSTGTAVNMHASTESIISRLTNELCRVKSLNTEREKKLMLEYESKLRAMHEAMHKAAADDTATVATA